MLQASNHGFVGADRQILNNGEAVIAIHNGEALFQSDELCFSPQNLYTKRMKSGHGELLGLCGISQ